METQEAMQALGEPEEVRVYRDGERDLAFRGWLLGEGTHGSGGEFEKDWTRGVKVRIYLTTGGRLVTSVARWSRWQGEENQYTAEVHTDADGALWWLMKDGGGKLGPASKGAWEAACDAYPPLAGEAVERVD